MDMSKIFLKEACPTSIGGQAVMEGVMMRGLDRTAIAVRIPDGRIHVKTSKNQARAWWTKVPILRGVCSFVVSLVEGTKTLTYSADVLEYFMEEEFEDEEPGKIEAWLTEKFGTQAIWNFMMALSVVIALAVSIGVFVLLPTAVLGLLRPYIGSAVVLNLIEGVARLLLFVGYVVLISRMEDIRRVFEYHGAEHKTIHCFENNLELVPKNAQTFYTLHPRCGTSFLMFVFVISLILFSLLGWPTLLWRIVSRLILLPVVAGLSYEVLKWAGRSDNIVVRILSLPGLYLQKLTTRPPSDEQLEVAIVSLKSVLVDTDAPCIEGIVDLDGNLIEPMDIEALRKARSEEQKEGAASEKKSAQAKTTADIDEVTETTESGKAEHEDVSETPLKEGANG